MTSYEGAASKLANVSTRGVVHPQLPHSLSLTVKKENAVLSLDGKKIKSPFSWEM